MSVLKSKRELSSAEHLKDLRDLEILLIQRAEKKLRSEYEFYNNIFLKDIINWSKQAYFHAVSAFVTEVRYQKDAELVHRHLQLAQGYIQNINTHLSIYYDLYKNQPYGLASHEMEEISALIFKAAQGLSREKKRTDKRDRYLMAGGRSEIDESQG